MNTAELDRLAPDAQRLLDAALGRWQRRRAAWSCVAAAVIFLFSAVDEGMAQWRSVDVSISSRFDLLVAVVLCLGYLGAALLFRRMTPKPRRVARCFGWVIMSAGAVGIVGATLVLSYDSQLWGPEVSESTRSFSAAGTALVVVFLVHFVGSIFVALPPWHALWPLLPLWLLYAGCSLLLEGPLGVRLSLAAAFPIVGIPGVCWSVWRHDQWVNRFTLELLGGRYGEVRRDLTDARRMHESIFPPQVEDGALRLRYRYEPMRELGGDFVFARWHDGNRLLLVVVDVTGHGVASALGVTRIHAALAAMTADSGESGDQGESDPGRILERLNAFVIEMLADQAIFASAVVVSVDGASGDLRWASAGHPPILVRRLRAGAGEGTAHAARNSVSELGATAPLLGAVDTSQFKAVSQHSLLDRGESVVICTDGVLEAEGAERSPFGAERLRDLVASEQGGIAAAVVRAVREHRGGSATDDLLVVEVERVAAS